MKKRIVPACATALLTLSLLALPATGRAQEMSDGEDGVFYLGSVLLSILHVPTKLVTCVGGQFSSALFYNATFDVPGHYEDGTNGRMIGETARLSCTGKWLVTPSQVKADYGS